VVHGLSTLLFEGPLRNVSGPERAATLDVVLSVVRVAPVRGG